MGSPSFLTTLATTGWLLLGGPVSQDSGSVLLEPSPPVRGRTTTITYSAAGGPLAGGAAINLHIGYNGWQDVSNPDLVMRNAGSMTWTYDYDVPTTATVLDLSFNDGIGASDDRGGANWHFSTIPPEPTVTPSPSPSVTPSPTVTATPSPTAAPSPSPSPVPTPGTSGRPGMGANPYTGGVTFRVWAPNATNVTVLGNFNGWNATANPMYSEGASGIWSVDVPNVPMGAQYKYAITNNGTTTQKIDPYARKVTNSVGNSVVVDKTFTWSPYTKPGFNEMVIYEMHVGTFNDAPGGLPGNWASAQAKLGHLQDLGINMIEVLPIAEFAGDYSWGYNPSHQFAPESIYGSVASMKTFVDEAHKKGIGVIVDVVHNHYGPSDLSLWRFDGPALGNGGIYFYTDFRKSTPWGDTRPDYGRGQVRTFIRDNAFYWLTEFNCDGLRWDSTCNIRNTSNGQGTDIPDGWSLMQWVNNDVDAQNPAKIIIAEDLQNNDYLTKTTGAGGAGFDSQWDAQFVHPVRDALITGDDTARSMASVRNAIVHLYNGQQTQRVVYTESHDEVANGKSRVPEEIWPGNAGSWASRKRSTLGAVLVFTSPGIPMIFEGQEFLENGYFADTDPIDWSKDTTYSGIKDLYRDLISLRKNTTTTTKGLSGNNTNVYHVNENGKVIGFRRWFNGGAGDDVIVIANFRNHTYASYQIGFPSEGVWNVRFNSDSTRYGADYTNVGGTTVTAVTGARDGMPANATVSLGPYSALILSK